MNGYGAGSIFIVTDQAVPKGYDAGFVGKAINEPGPASRLFRDEGDLVGNLPLPLLPDWVPPLSLRDAFVVDELAVWFCNRGLSTGRYHWRENDLIEIVRVLWEKRIPVAPSEMVAVLLAHGLDANFQQEAEKLLAFGQQTLVAAQGRRPIRNRRLGSFEDIVRDRNRLVELFV